MRTAVNLGQIKLQIFYDEVRRVFVGNFVIFFKKRWLSYLGRSLTVQAASLYRGGPNNKKQR